jgi:hypothetical protein
MTSCCTDTSQIERVVADTRAAGLRVDYDPDDAGTLQVWNGPYPIYWALRKGEGADVWIVRYDPSWFQGGAPVAPEGES